MSFDQAETSTSLETPVLPHSETCLGIAVPEDSDDEVMDNCSVPSFGRMELMLMIFPQ